MNAYFNLSPQEIEWLMDAHAANIGCGDEAESDRSCKRIQQLQRYLTPHSVSEEWQPDPALELELAA